ncbi:hypothetical protein SI65_03281 [Aspergillus cristatus]|uniref:Uncharacterized protein n=1 Tax=Aspergillus cristatus TaxID=573508 RepID=A0A1E3BH57_ASPCR|nr:hypothetical protein SI65_03281 [Aspergillus cristatus]
MTHHHYTDYKARDMQDDGFDGRRLPSAYNDCWLTIMINRHGICLQMIKHEGYKDYLATGDTFMQSR